VTTSTSPAVELRGLTKRFGGVLANDAVTLRVQRGVLHGIVGENGAGKSTAMKMLYGIYQPDAGEIWVKGEKKRWRSPSDPIACGIGMVHQHFMLAGPDTALDNIIVGVEPGRFGLVNRRHARRRLQAVAEQYGLEVDLDKKVEELPVGVQQRVEILKLLFREADILILDEPTAVLTPQETTALFRNLRRLRDQGKTILLITHKLKEVIDFTDRVTVFRAGKVAGECETAKTNPQELADLMVGRIVSLRVDVAPARHSKEQALEVAGLFVRREGSQQNRLADVNFQVQRGEIVGIAGVEGNGQTELLQALLHPAEPACRHAGTVKVLEQDVSNWRSREIRALGVGLIPEDRHSEALLLDRPLMENFVLGLQRQPAFASRGWLRMNNISQAAARAVTDYDVRPPDPALPIASFSGGNQQKLIIAREFERQPKILIAAQPTRGVDVGAIEFIHRRLVRARDGGAGVLLVSTELDEILTLADRILVLYEGRIVAQFSRGEATEAQIGLKMGGG